MADPVFYGYSSQAWSGFGGANFAHDGGTDDNRILFVYVEQSDWGGVTEVTYGGQSLTQQFSGTSSWAGGRPSTLTVWYLISPPSGSNTVIVTAGGNESSKYVAVAATYTGASQNGSNFLKSGQEKSTAYSDNNSDPDQVTFSHAPTADDSSLVINAWTTSWATVHGGRQAGQTERAEVGDGGPGGISVTDRAGSAAAVTVSGSSTGNPDGTTGYSWSHVLLPPQNVTVDASAVPASGATSATIGTVDDGNIGINVEFLIGTLSMSIGSITIRPPIEADM